MAVVANPCSKEPQSYSLRTPRWWLLTLRLSKYFNRTVSELSTKWTCYCWTQKEFKADIYLLPISFDYPSRWFFLVHEIIIWMVFRPFSFLPAHYGDPMDKDSKWSAFPISQQIRERNCSTVHNNKYTHQKNVHHTCNIPATISYWTKQLQPACVKMIGVLVCVFGLQQTSTVLLLVLEIE